MPKQISPLVFTALLVVSAACGDEVVGINPGPTEGSITVNASQSWQYIALADSTVVTPASAPGESANWDIAFFATNVTLNGGEAGPGGVTGACICQNEGATGDEVLAMTAESELSDFESVQSVPAGTTFQSDVLTPAIAGWFTGSGAAAVADTTKSWLVRLSDSTSFAVVRIKQINGATATAPGIVTLEYRLQSSSAAALGAVQTVVVLANSTAPQLVDLNTGSVTTSASAWDLRIDGFTIRVNSGITGSGKAGAAANATAFASTATAVTAANAYRADAYAGIFGQSRFFRYNIAGDHRISPNFNVYLIRRGSTVYKLQVTSYYSLTGQARHITFRWQQLD